MKEKSVAITIHNLTKQYRLYDRPLDRLREVLNPFKRKYHKDFEALSIDHLELYRGEVVGIVGKNGSGKSTLLKILTGVLNQTSGNFHVNGKIAALLELGAGFNPDLTGLENIYLNGALMGYSREEIERKKEAIIEFADIGDFLYQPVRIYSSGMFARLAFSVAINVEPDVLIVDEALSVGDVFFQAKCYAYFQSLSQKNTTVLFVTHNLDIVVRTCTTAFFLDQGRLISRGNPLDVIEAFKRNNVGEDHDRESTNNNFLGRASNKNFDEYGTGEVKILDFGLFKDGVAVQHSVQGEEIVLNVWVQSFCKVQNFIAAFAIKTVEGIDALGFNTEIADMDLSNISDKGVRSKISFKFKNYLRAGDYTLSLGLTQRQKNGELTVFHRLYHVANLHVVSAWGGTGLCSPEVCVKVNSDDR